MAGGIRAYIGLGANVGEPRRTLERAVSSLASLPSARLVGVSRLYRSRPVGVLDQPDFLNAVAALELPAPTDPTRGAIDLLVELKRLERESGRRHRRRWGPRELDLDLLLYADHRIVTDRPPEAMPASTERDPGAAARLLEVPHPAMGERLFVLAPLADLAPGLVPPSWGSSVETARVRRLGVEGPDAVVAIGAWDRTAGAWRAEPDGPRT